MIVRLVIAMISVLTLISQPATAQPELPNGGSINGSLGDGTAQDAYTFTGNAGETVAITMVDTGDGTASAVYPLLELYQPNGDYQAQAFGDTVASFSDRGLPVTGTYTVIAKDRFDSSSGDGNYTIHFAKAAGANEGGTLPNGLQVQGNLTIGDLDSFTFEADSGDTVALKLAYSGTNLPARNYPQLFVYRPDGLRFATNFQQYTTSIIDKPITVPGTYTVIARNRHTFQEGFGSYTLQFAKVHGANDSGVLLNNQTVNSDFSYGDLDTYTFYAHFGDTFTITLSDTGAPNEVYPAMSVYQPSGSRLAFNFGPDQALVSTGAQSTGLHTVLAYNRTGFDTGQGDYSISLSCTGNCTAPAPICNGELVTVDLNLGQSTTSGNDVVLGTPGDDDIRGKAGDDIICGMGGNDFIHGNSGNDWIEGGDGVDNLRGGRGADVLLTGAGATVGTASRAFGGYDNDFILGGPDDDDLRGGRGEDQLEGGAGADLINGNQDDDVGFGDAGADTVKGGGGESDELYGGTSADSLDGGSGSSDFCDGGGQGGDTDTNCELF